MLFWYSVKKGCSKHPFCLVGVKTRRKQNNPVNCFVAEKRTPLASSASPPLAVPEKAFGLSPLLVFFDRCANSASLHLPPEALGFIAQSRNLLCSHIPQLKIAFVRTNKKGCSKHPFCLVGVKGLEPPASCSQSRRATNCATPRN